MKRILAILLAIALVFCLTACQQTKAKNTNQVSSVSDTGDASSRQSVSRPSKKPTGSSSSSVTEESLPESVSGKFQGKTVTVSCRARIKIDWEYPQIYFTNGYAAFRYSDVPYENAGLIVTDYDGNIRFFTDKRCGYISDFSTFDQNGIAVIEHENMNPTSDDDVYKFSFVNTKGEILGDATINDYKQRCKPYEELHPKEKTSDGARKIVQNTYYDENGEKDHIYSLVDEKGNVIHTFPTETHSVGFHSDHLLIAHSSAPFPHYLYDRNAKPLYLEPFDTVAPYAENGLLPFVKDEKLGLMDEKGEIVIPATFESLCNFQTKMFLSEGHIVTYQKDYITILQVTIQ